MKTPEEIAERVLLDANAVSVELSGKALQFWHHRNIVRDFIVEVIQAERDRAQVLVAACEFQSVRQALAAYKDEK